MAPVGLVGRWPLLVVSTWLWAVACSMPDYRISEPQQDGVGLGAVHCKNGLLDAALGETDFDCGGGCAPCSAGHRCGRDVDCTDNFCNLGICMAPGCANGVRDGGEADVDCGGAACPKCAAGTACNVAEDCQSLLCDAGRCLTATCDDNLQNGTETGRDCGGACPPCSPAVAGCAAGRADCNGDASDGCEVLLQTDDRNCGQCGRSCQVANASATACVDGTCDPVCEPGYAACSSPELGCTTGLGSSENCAACGDVCDANTPFCTSSGCQGALAITVEGAGVRAMKAWNGSAFGAELALEHQLVHGKGAGRLVLVGVSASGTGAGPFTVTYDDQPMIKAVEVEHESRQTYAAIYYLLDAQLPAQPGTTNQARVVFNSGQWWGYGGLDVLELTGAQQKAPLLSNTAVGANCNGATTRGVSLSFDSPGALVYGVLSSRGATSPPSLQQVPPLTKTWSQNVDNGGSAQSAGAGWVIDDDTRNLQWTLNNCETSVAAGVVIERLQVN